MKYQLVLQWLESSILEYGLMIEIEDVLTEGLSKEHDVDGHDAGAGQINIFIHTDEPLRAFEEVKGLLGTRTEWGDIKVAYRDMSGDKFVIVWPKRLKVFEVA